MLPPISRSNRLTFSQSPFAGYRRCNPRVPRCKNRESKSTPRISPVPLASRYPLPNMRANSPRSNAFRSRASRLSVSRNATMRSLFRRVSRGLVSRTILAELSPRLIIVIVRILLNGSLSRYCQTNRFALLYYLLQKTCGLSSPTSPSFRRLLERLYLPCRVFPVRQSDISKCRLQCQGIFCIARLIPAKGIRNGVNFAHWDCMASDLDSTFRHFRNAVSV